VAALAGLTAEIESIVISLAVQIFPRLRKSNPFAVLIPNPVIDLEAGIVVVFAVVRASTTSLLTEIEHDDVFTNVGDLALRAKAKPVARSIVPIMCEGSSFIVTALPLIVKIQGY
jgi:hypothetical protein